MEYLTHRVSVGDTIQAIALEYKVSWTELVDINGLIYPYLDDTLVFNEFEDSSEVAKVGSVLLIPSSGIQVPNKLNNSSADIEKYAFGADLDIFTYEETETGTINLQISGQLTDDGAGDLLFTEGKSNLKQQILIRLGVQKGFLLNHPEFGSEILKYVGKKGTVETLTEVSLEVKETILKDFRVSSVENVVVTFVDNGIRIECDIYPVQPYTPFSINNIIG